MVVRRPVDDTNQIENNRSAQPQHSDLSFLSLQRGERPFPHQQTAMQTGDRSTPNPVSPDGALQFGPFDQLYGTQNSGAALPNARQVDFAVPVRLQQTKLTLAHKMI